MSVVFVAGGAGFIGLEVVRELIARGHSVRALARSEASAQAMLSAGAEVVSGDLLREGAWQKSAADADFIVHLAQPTTFGGRVTKARAEAYRNDRLVMDRNLLAPLAPGRAQRILYVSGTSYYGDQGTELRDEDATPNPRGFGPYVAPAMAELDGHIKRGLPIVTALPGSVYGDGSWFREYVLRPLRKGRRIFTLMGRSRFASLIHVRDCARALVYLLEKGEVGRRYFVVDDKPVPWITFYGAAAKALGRDLTLRRMPAFLMWLLTGPIVTESILSDGVLSNARLKALGFEFLFPTIDEGVRDVVANARPPRG